MGRKKIEIKFIKDEKNRLVTFAKRKSGLFKKAYELSVLCECEIALLVFTRSNRLYQYASVTVDHALQRLKKHHRANEFLSNSDMERLTKRRMRSNCNGPGVIPQQPYSNIKNEESNNGDDNDDEEEDDDDEVEGEEEETGSILSVKNINNNCQIIDVDKAKFTDQIDIQSSNVRYIVDTQQQPTFNMHSRSSVNTVTENHIRPVSSIALPLNPLIITSTNPVVTSDYLTHIQPVLASHASNTQLQFSSNAHLIQYHRPLHQSAQCSPASPFTCDNTIVHSKPLCTTLPNLTSQPVEQVNNLLLPSQMSTPYLIQHPSADHQTTLPIECSNRNNGHLLGAAGGVGGGDAYMETSLNHPYRDTTSIMDSGVSSNFSANSNNSNNTLGQMQCTLLTPVPYTKELKTDQPMFIISSVVGNNNNSNNNNNNNSNQQQQQQISKPDLIPSLTVESSTAVRHELHSIPQSTNKHSYSGTQELHRKMNDYISDVYESHINHFTSNSMSSLQNSATTTTIVCAPSLTVPTKTNMNPQCVTSNNSIPVTSNLPVKNSDASSQTLPEIIDLDGLPASLSTSFSTTVVVTTSEMYANTPHDNHLTENDNTNNNNNNNNSNNDCRSNHNNDSDSSNTVETEPNEMKISEDDSGNSTTVSQPQQQQQQQQQHHSRQRRMPALKHLQLPSTCSSTLLRQTSIPKGYFLSTPEVINELGRLDSHRNTNSSTDNSDSNPLGHALSPADLIYRLGLHQLLSLSPVPLTSRDSPVFSANHSPTPSLIPSNSNSGSNQNTVMNSASSTNSTTATTMTIAQPSLVSQSSCTDIPSVQCESESQNSPNVLPKYAKRSKYS